MTVVRVTLEVLRSGPLSQELKDADTIEVTNSQGELVLVMMRNLPPLSED